jgi:tetratricopeptide (TPR) repeat protein
MKLARLGFSTAATFAIATLLFTIPAAAQDWVGRGRIAGTVTDEDGNMIEGATVKIWIGEDDSRGPASLVTKKNGRWGFLGIKYGIWTVLVTKDGKMPSQGQVSVGSATKPIPVKLRDIPEELLYNERALEAKKRLEEGNVLLQGGDPAAARAKYTEALVDLEAEHHADILIAIAASYSQENDLGNAKKSLQEALAASPDNPKVLLELARVSYNEGNIEDAIGSLQNLLTVDPNNETALRVVSDMLVSQGRVDEAQEYMARLPEGAKLDPNALLNVGIDHYNAGELEEALERFDEVVNNYPEMATALYYRGLVYLGRGENDLAATDLKKFIEMDPDSAKAAEATEFLSYLEPQ